MLFYSVIDTDNTHNANGTIFTDRSDQHCRFSTSITTQQITTPGMYFRGEEEEWKNVYSILED